MAHTISAATAGLEYNGTPLMVRVVASNVSPGGSAERIEYVSRAPADSLSVAAGKIKLKLGALAGTALSGNRSQLGGMSATVMRKVTSLVLPRLSSALSVMS